MSHKRVGLHLCEHNSTVWFHFSLLESAMFWPIWALSSCICGKVGEEERVRGYDLGGCGILRRSSGLHPCCRRKVILSEIFLRFSSVRVPVHLFKDGEGAMSDLFGNNIPVRQ